MNNYKWSEEINKYLLGEVTNIKKNTLDTIREKKDYLTHLIEIRNNLNYRENEHIFKQYAKLELMLKYKNGKIYEHIDEILWDESAAKMPFKKFKEQMDRIQKLVTEKIQSEQVLSENKSLDTKLERVGYGIVLQKAEEWTFFDQHPSRKNILTKFLDFFANWFYKPAQASIISLPQLKAARKCKTWRGEVKDKNEKIYWRVDEDKGGLLLQIGSNMTDFVKSSFFLNIGNLKKKFIFQPIKDQVIAIASINKEERKHINEKSRISVVWSKKQTK